MKFVIGGFPPETTEQEIREPLEEFGAVITKVTIQPSEKEDGFLAIVEVDTDETGRKVLAEKINGKMWKGRKLRAPSILFLK